MTPEDPVQEGNKVLKLKTKMANKENIDNTVEKSCIPLKADEVTSSDIYNLKDNIQAIQAQTMTSDQVCHLKDNKKIEAKQDANMPKKQVLGFYHSQVVQSKINSFRKLANVKGERESPATTKKLPTTMSKASKVPSAPGNAVSMRASDVTATTKFVNTKSVSTTSKNTLVQPPVRSLHRQNKNPVGSFWTTMAEEDEQRLFTEKVDKTISECLNLMNKKGCPKEEILDTLNDLIHNIPDPKELVKSCIYLVRMEPITSPIENIISVYKKAILTGAQPTEEMRQIIIDILTMKSQEKVNLGENTEEAHETKGHSQEVKTEDTSVTLEPGDPGAENECQRKVQVCENSQDREAKDPTNNSIIPDSKTEAGCLIRYNVSSTQCLQSLKNMQHGVHEKTSQLPDTLKDPDPSVSSLGQLSELEEDAFICTLTQHCALCSLRLT
ncbi:hypothetical protein U0070_004044 [Myodes glareolus]|uniref:Cytoskeleton-associated protein 2 C-terminal domain-containing protein n=1 Tax=Myodes glareolus TaxID=447135 RepID=A0AAW0K9N8_MYOGA